MGAPSYGWIAANLAIWLIGAILVPIYETDSQAQVDFIKRETGLKLLLCNEQLNDLNGLKEAGKSILSSELANISNHVEPKTPAAVIFTSGTTGNPKGVTLTHANFIGAVRGVINEPPPHGLLHNIGTPESRYLAFLPLSHVLALMVTHTVLSSRGQLSFCPDIANLISALQAFRPTFLVAVPRVFRFDTVAAKENLLKKIRPIIKVSDENLKSGYYKF